MDPPVTIGSCKGGGVPSPDPPSLALQNVRVPTEASDCAASLEEEEEEDALDSAAMRAAIDRLTPDVPVATIAPSGDHARAVVRW
tara:strand:- start:275 stop:529 length:255 start_codon:yes stop_codon:yes gene_type:complete